MFARINEINYCEALLPRMTGRILRTAVFDFGLFSTEVVVVVGTVAEGKTAVDEACEVLAITCCVLADV